MARHLPTPNQWLASPRLVSVMILAAIGAGLTTAANFVTIGIGFCTPPASHPHVLRRGSRSQNRAHGLGAPLAPRTSKLRQQRSSRSVTSRRAFFPFFDNGRFALKEELLNLVGPTRRGADETQNAAIIAKFEALEQRNPTSSPLRSPLLRGDWELLWTTSSSILGLGRLPFFRPLDDRPILQFLDPSAGYARNLEFTPFGPNRVEAEIAPLNDQQKEAFISKLDDFLLFKQGSVERPGGTYLPKGLELERNTVGVRFKVFKVFDILAIPAPEGATGILQVTYLDEDLRLSRGDRGNLFVLRKAGSENTA